MTIKSLTLQSMSDNDLTWISTSQEHNYNVWPKDVKILLVRGSLVVCFQLCSNSLLFQHEKVYLVWCWRAVTSTPRTTFMNWIAYCEFLSSNSPASDSAYLSSTSPIAYCRCSGEPGLPAKRHHTLNLFRNLWAMSRILHSRFIQPMFGPHWWSTITNPIVRQAVW